MKRTLTIEKGNTRITLKDYDPDTQVLLTRFCNRFLARWSKVPGDTWGTTKMVVSHRFATFSTDKKELRMAIGFYDELKSYLSALGLKEENITETIIPEIIPKATDYPWINDIPVLPRNNIQEKYCDFMVREDKPLVVNNAVTGGGKSARNDTLVQTPTGWTQIGSLKVGDEVIAKDGTITRVTGVYPQGKLPINKITFYDNRTSYCCDNHLWKVFNAKRVRDGKAWSVINTKEIKKRLALSQPRLYIPLNEVYDPEPVDTFIDPYLFGALLGDGGLSVINVCSFTNADEFVVDKVNAKLNEIGLKLTPVKNRDYNYNVTSLIRGVNDGRQYFFNVVNELRLQVLSIHKRIPDIFLQGSKEQRLELLRGLMDTDGYVGRGGNPSYNTTSEQLALDVQRLVWSLGGIAKVTSRIPKYSHNGEKKEGLLAYRVWIRHPEPESIVTLPRRLERLSNDNQYASKLKLRIRSVEPAGEAECTCISVEHPDRLFVIEDYIVTHNTYMALYTMYQLATRTVITVLPRYSSIWIAAFSKFFNFTADDIYDVSREDIFVFLDKLKKGEINPKVIIFPLTRVDTYLKRFREEPENIPHLDEVFNIMQGGIRLIDEAHESIYSVYMSTLYGNFKKNIALSATLRGDDDFINKIYKAAFPDDAYLMAPVYEKYIDVVALHHRMRMDKYRINVKGFGGYSHTKLEKAILANKRIFENYYQTCKAGFEEFYLKEYQEGQKFVWFFATIAMCKEMQKRFLHDYPDLDLFVFTGEVSKKKSMELEYLNHQGLVTTPTSLSTGKDIPKLFTVFACVAISSSQRNDQMNGRARPVHEWFPGCNPKFVYWVCPDIPKQVEYDKKRRTVLDKKTKSFKVFDTGIWV